MACANGVCASAVMSCNVKTASADKRTSVDVEPSDVRLDCFIRLIPTTKYMAYSIQIGMLENRTEMTILVFIAAVHAAVQLRVTNAASIKAQWARAAPALHTHRFCAAHACGVKRA